MPPFEGLVGEWLSADLPFVSGSGVASSTSANVSTRTGAGLTPSPIWLSKPSPVVGMAAGLMLPNSPMRIDVAALHLFFLHISSPKAGRFRPRGRHRGHGRCDKESSPACLNRFVHETLSCEPSPATTTAVIAANGTEVRGSLGTNGADDPATSAHESVSGASKIDPGRVHDDFFRELRPLARPASGIFRLPPAPGEPFVAGTPSQPAFYLISQDMHAFDVSPPASDLAGAIVIMINGNLTVPDGAINIARNVQAQIFVSGNVDFYNRPINVGGFPAQLQIYGEDSKGATRTLRAFGEASITAAFYGPHYDIKLADNVEWFGAAVGKSFEMLGGGVGGFHYDEALALVGAPIGFRIARYIEDVR